MKKVVLLGDSIRLIGYGPLIQDLMPEGVKVYQPEDNCRFAQYFLRMLFDFKADFEGSDVIHFNVGLWDVPHLFKISDDDSIFTPIEFYLDTLGRIADLLLKYSKKVIFSTTTFIKGDYPFNDNKDIVEYNKRAIELLEKKGVIINDLCSKINEDLDGNICEDQIHLSEKGKKIASEMIAKVIIENL